LGGGLGDVAGDARAGVAEVGADRSVAGADCADAERRADAAAETRRRHSGPVELVLEAGDDVGALADNGTGRSRGSCA